MRDLGHALVVQGDAAHLPLPDNSVDLVCTSPPYFALRSYQDGGQHYPGQVGSEPTPQEFLDALIACTAEWVRVLKPSGSIFVNLGDKYAGSGGGGEGSSDGMTGRASRPPRRDVGIRTKSLMLLPERYRIGAVDQLGLIARAVIIWSKPNGLPESVTDRVRRSHEDWVHLTKEPRYYSAVDDIREAQSSLGRKQGGPNGKAHVETLDAGRRLRTDTHLHLDARGKLPGSVWSIPTEPLQVPAELGVDHFAAYPTEWPRRIIQGWSPRHVCTACGEGRRPVTEVQPQPGLTGELIETRRREPGDEQTRQIAAFIRNHREAKGMTRNEVDTACGTNTSCSWWEGRSNGIQLPGPVLWRRLQEVLDLPPTWDHIMLDTYMRPSGRLTSGPALLSGRNQTAGSTGLRSSSIVTGYACNCPTPDAPTRPGVVLDPFGGTGTTALVARALGRDAINIDLSHDYSRLAAWRTTNPDQLAKALGVDKPPTQTTGQDVLFA